MAPMLVKLNFKRGEVTSPDIGTATEERSVGIREGFPRFHELLWNSGERKCRAPSGNVSPSSSDRASICLEADSRPVCDAIAYIVRVARECAEFRPARRAVTVVNFDLFAHSREIHLNDK